MLELCKVIHCAKLHLKRLGEGVFNPIQDGGGGQKGPLPVFPLQFLQTWELARKTFWLLVLILLPRWCKIPRPYQSQIIELEPRPPLKKAVFLVKSL